MSWFAKIMTRDLVSEAVARRWSEYSCYVAAIAILFLGYRKISRMAMTEVELYMSVMLTLLVAFVTVVAGAVISLKEAARIRAAKGE